MGAGMHPLLLQITDNPARLFLNPAASACVWNLAIASKRDLSQSPNHGGAANWTAWWEVDGEEEKIIISRCFERASAASITFCGLDPLTGR